MLQRAPCFGWTLVFTVATASMSGSWQAQRVTGPASIASWVISPAVVATFVAHGDAQLPEQIRETLAAGRRLGPSGPVTLDVLILWRGRPGWFLHDDRDHESGGGDSSGNVNVHLERGGIALDAVFDPEKRVLRIGRAEVALGNANVVMVDGVDVPGGLSIAGMRTVEGRVQPPPEGLYEVFRGAPDLVPFLRCEAPLPGRTAAVPSTSCAGIIR